MKQSNTGGKSKPAYLKVLICVIGIGGVVAAGSYLAYRSASIESATATVPIETTTAETETPIDNEVLRVEYENEARLKWDENIENLEGDKEAFVSEWVDLRISGLDVDSTYGRLYEKYQKKGADLGITPEEAFEGLENNGSDIDDGSEPVVTEQTEPTETATAASAAYTVIPIDPVTLYATANVNIRNLPDVSGDKVGALSYTEGVTATGTVKEFGGVACYWLEVTTANGLTGFVNGGYLVEEQPVPQTPPASTGNNTSNSNSNSGASQSQAETSGNQTGTATPPADFTLDSGFSSQDELDSFLSGSQGGGYKEPVQGDGTSLGLH